MQYHYYHCIYLNCLRNIQIERNCVGIMVLQGIYVTGESTIGPQVQAPRSPALGDAAGLALLKHSY